MQLTFSAQNWFKEGQRVPYDPQKKEILESQVAGHKTENQLHAFHKIQTSAGTFNGLNNITFLPGFPDGSFGWTRTQHILGKADTHDRLFIEYIGQGDSDKPEDYPYSTFERADLVQAFWNRYKVKNTTVVAFDYSALVVMELLRRQQDEERGQNTFCKTKIAKVIIINGGLFADSHSHPYLTTPLLKTPFGKLGTRIAQNSQLAFNLMMKDLWSKEYQVSRRELKEHFDVITRRNGAVFMSNAAGFVDEHKKNAARWDFLKIYKEMNQQVSFMVVGSEKDPFEAQQVVKAKVQLEKLGLSIQIIPGGHMSTSEQPHLLAEIISKI